jgi:hypothetical protein
VGESERDCGILSLSKMKFVLHSGRLPLYHYSIVWILVNTTVMELKMSSLSSQKLTCIVSLIQYGPCSPKIQYNIILLLNLKFSSCYLIFLDVF